MLLNWQMVGMLLGGILWGIMGDKRGRRSVLFGSIALYSIANIGNAFVTSVEAYAAMRFFAGLGLAGELGAAVTLVSEVLPKHLRGYGTMIVSAVGILGAVAGYYIARMPFAVAGLAAWQMAYLVGGLLGLVLLAARVAISESSMFKSVESRTVVRGSLLMLFNNWDRARRFLLSALIGLPLWCAIGILVGFSREISLDLGITGPVDPGRAILFCYVGLSAGSLASGAFSQYVQSRRTALIAFISLLAGANFVYFFSRGISPDAFYLICSLIGIAGGYWAVFIQVAAEQFGTNLRATVATSVPNLIRGSTVPLTLMYQFWLLPFFDQAESAMLLLSLCCIVALFSVRFLAETYGKDLNFVEGVNQPLASASVPRASASKAS
jgi:MFS family permease